ncbi:MAG: SUMF1/EgtB/PvdO family nonheme iron enzyme [Candidatus Sabulitectum sp.]|nr:SUMF1/EgtB/PvdO family nonheme iron enzyme [Candidatus Sabulitectum sp.]
MRLVLLALVSFTMVAIAWQCPACGGENDGSFCVDCYLPQPPGGMVYVPATTVEVNGVMVDVSPFFLDEQPVTYRDFIPWLNGSGFGVNEMGIIITGGGDETMQFLAFTPFIGDQGGGITVPSQCLENPVASITWSGAQSFLSDTGKRLPTLAEIEAAASHGLIDVWDSYETMQAFAGQMQSSMGEMLGTLNAQAMFAGYSSANERIMWELTGTVFDGNPTATAVSIDVSYITLFKALSEPLVSSTSRDMGYFNVIFRGAIEVP